MLAAGYGNVSDFEIMWTAIATIGFIFAVLNLIGVIGDFRRLRSAGIKNGRWYMAKLAVVTESGRAYLQLFFVLVGAYSMTLPDPPPTSSDLHDEIINAAIRWGFLTAAVWTCGKTVYTWYVYKRLTEDNDEIPVSGKPSADMGKG